MASSALAVGVRQLRGLATRQRRADENDEPLLHAFTTRRDEAAFVALVRRHGPMVLGVCRRVLGHEQDAEDAFQATFLVLARNAAKLRQTTALSSFLHGTAYRMALMAKRTAARRRKHEANAPARKEEGPGGELLWREVRTLLDEEIARLPETYRAVFVLCCLEGMSREEAARQLNLKEGTASSRLAEARKRLQRRLARRGVELTALLAACALATPVSALPPMLRASTIEVALARTASQTPPHVAALVQGIVPTALVGKTTMAAIVLTVGMLLGAGVWACRTAPPPAAEQPEQAPQPPAKKKVVNQRTEKDAVGRIKGRVLLPNGKPAAKAVIWRLQWDEATASVKQTQLTITGADGRFEVEPKSSATLIASTPGLAPDWVKTEFVDGELILRLAERATVKGRLINLEGKPVAGARVKVVAVKVPAADNPKAAVDAFRLNPEWTGTAMPKVLSGPVPDSTPEAKTGADGRFELSGFGTSRILELQIEVDGIESAKLHVVLADDFDPKAVLPRPSERAKAMTRGTYRPTVYGPRFTHAVRPCQIITGVIRDEATGKPIAGAKVIGTTSSLRKFDHSAWHDAVESVTDREGRYRLNGLPKAKGRHLHVQPGDAPCLDRLIEVPDVETFDPVRVDVNLSAAVVVEGRLADKATEQGVRGTAFYLPLRSAALDRFLVKHPEYGQTQAIRPSGVLAVTDAKGRFKLRVPPVPGVILARADTMHNPVTHYAAIRVAEADRKYLLKPPKEATQGNATSRQGPFEDEVLDTNVLIHPLRWENGYAVIDPKKKAETVQVVLRFDPGRTKRGKIVGPDGRPLTGVKAVGVQATDERCPTTFSTDAYSVFALDPSRPRTMYFWHKEKNLIGAATLRGDETEAPLVKMRAAGVVTGRMCDEAGKPIAGLEISFQLSKRQPDGAIRQTLHGGALRSAITGTDGRFRLEGMFPGLELTVFAGRPGLRSVAISFPSITLKDGEVRDLGDGREESSR
jgi:RNA polymerase sigma factor (sigma-70 family)